MPILTLTIPRAASLTSLNLRISDVKTMSKNADFSSLDCSLANMMNLV